MSSYTQVFRPSALGFDRLFDMMDAFADRGGRQTFPPHSVWKLKTDQPDTKDYRIEIAVAGYSRDELEVERDGPMLTVSSKGSEREAPGEPIYLGLANRSWKLSFTVDERAIVRDVTLKDGLLSLDIHLPPSDMSMKRLTIN